MIERSQPSVPSPELLPRDEDAPRIFCPGPVMLSDRVRWSAARCDYGHRDRAFLEILDTVRSGLLTLADAREHEALLIAGSGTSAVEATLTTFLREGTLLVVSNGSFGERMAAIAETIGVRCRHLRYPWGQEIAVAEVDAALREDPGIAAVGVVQHETSVGRVNPVVALGRVARGHGRRLLVDAISSLGAEPLSARETGASLIIGTPNKCLHAMSGLAFVLVASSEWQHATAGEPHAFYLDLRRYRRTVCGGETPFTPSVHAVVALREALAELEEQGGSESRRQRYLAHRTLLEEAMPRLGLLPHAGTAQPSSSTLVVRLPEGRAAIEFRDGLRARGYLLYLCRGALAADHLIVSVMGCHRDQDVAGLLDALAEEVAAGRSRV